MVARWCPDGVPIVSRSCPDGVPMVSRSLPDTSCWPGGQQESVRRLRCIGLWVDPLCSRLLFLHEPKFFCLPFGQKNGILCLCLNLAMIWITIVQQWFRSSVTESFDALRLVGQFVVRELLCISCCAQVKVACSNLLISLLVNMAGSKKTKPRPMSAMLPWKGQKKKPKDKESVGQRQYRLWVNKCNRVSARLDNNRCNRVSARTMAQQQHQ